MTSSDVSSHEWSVAPVTVANEGVRPPGAIMNLSRLPNRTRTTLVLLAIDVLSLAIATTLALVVARTMSWGIDPLAAHWLPLLALFPLSFSLLNLYPAAGLGPVEELRRIVTCITAIYFGLSVLYIVAFPASREPLLILFALWLATCFLVPTGRSAVRYLFATKTWWGVPAIVIGAGKTAELVVTRLRHNVGLNLKPIVALDDDERKLGTSIGGIPVIGTLAYAAGIKRASNADFAIIAMPGVSPDRMSELVHTMGRFFSQIVVIPNMFGITSVGVGTRDSGGIVGLYVHNHLSVRSNRFIKRCVDLALLVPAALLALPVVALCAIAVMIVSPGNPFYSQERGGFGGRRIDIWKLRTMHPGADSLLEELLADDPSAREEWNTHFKLTRDPRIIPVVGRILRRLSLDELPQLLNIALGQLSFVGPRPFPYYHLDQFDDTFREMRQSVVPGLTGYWQVTSRSTADLVAQIELDSYYIKNWSLWLDAYILARTPWAVFFGSGAY